MPDAGKITLSADGKHDWLLTGFAEQRAFLRRLALLRLGDADLAEDVVQDTFEGALRSAPAFAGRSSPRTWLVGILKHKIADRLRAGHAAPVPFSSMPAELDVADLARLFDHEGYWASPPSLWGDPESVVLDRDFLAALEQCLDHLPRASARAFVMRELMEMESREICAELGVTANHLGVLLYRARISLRGCLEHNWLAPEGRTHADD